MVNYTNIMENNYNLTNIFSSSAIDNPTSWLSNFNSELSGLFFIALLAVFAIILYILAKEIDNVKDSQAAVYSGFIVTIIGVLLFFIEVGGEKLLSFNQLLIFIIATALAILADRIIRNY